MRINNIMLYRIFFILILSVFGCTQSLASDVYLEFSSDVVELNKRIHKDLNKIMETIILPSEDTVSLVAYNGKDNAMEAEQLDVERFQSEGLSYLYECLKGTLDDTCDENDELAYSAVGKDYKNSGYLFNFSDVSVDPMKEGSTYIFSGRFNDAETLVNKLKNIKNYKLYFFRESKEQEQGLSVYILRITDGNNELLTNSLISEKPNNRRKTKSQYSCKAYLNNNKVDFISDKKSCSSIKRLFEKYKLSQIYGYKLYPLIRFKSKKIVLNDCDLNEYNYILHSSKSISVNLDKYDEVLKSCIDNSEVINADASQFLRKKTREFSMSLKFYKFDKYRMQAIDDNVRAEIEKLNAYDDINIHLNLVVNN